MSAAPWLRNISEVDDLDELDLKLIEHIKLNDDWTYRSAAEHAQTTSTTAFRRICRIRRSDFVTAMREDLQRLGPDSAQAILAGLTDPDMAPCAQIAIRLNSGLGVLVDKHTVGVKLDDATPEQIQAALDKLSTDQLRAMLRRRSTGGDDSDDNRKA